MDGGAGLLMFHCLTFLRENIYYLETHDAVIIAEINGSEMFCYDVYTQSGVPIQDLLGIIAAAEMTEVTLGFTPVDGINCNMEKANEDDTTVFILHSKENIFENNRITLPFLSRA
jgi:hypothetical protein